MFEAITESLGSALEKLTSRGKLTERNIEEGLRQVRLALLSADVNQYVVRDFIENVKERAVGKKVLESIRPGDQIVKIVHDELVELMGPTDTKIERPPEGPAIIMVCGLQGSGKTTTCGKLALHLQKQGADPLLVAADVQRPGAIDQLKQLGEQLEVPVYSEKPGWLSGKPPRLCKNAVKQAKKNGNDYVILDTAGRLHIDEELMKELQSIRSKVDPHNTFLVVDAMVGQDAVRSAKEFDERLPLTGVVLTKLDGDARGGAALSIRAVTGKPVKFCGTGEKLDRLEEFHPDRMANRILGMGDVVSLVEKAQETIDEDEALSLRDKLMEDRFGLDDFLAQLQRVKKMGPLKEILSMIPGMGSQLQDIDVDEAELGRIEAIIKSMTPEERRDPEILNGSRRRRIASGSGTSVTEVNMLMEQFDQMREMVQAMTQGGGGLLGGGLGGMMPGGPGQSKRKKKKKKKKKKPF